MLSTALSKILAAKALAAVVLLAGATGGVALAATVSGLPSSPPADQPAATIAPTATPPSPSDDPEPAAQETAASEPDPDASPSPHPSLAGLCKAWAAGATDNPGKAAENPAFGALIEAAGSAEKVPGYCADLQDADQPGKSGTAPGHDGEDRGAPPTAAPGNLDRPAGPPADSPGAAANRGVPPTAAPGNPDRPAGPPADRAEKDGDQQDGDKQDKGTGSKPDDQGRNGDSASN